MNYPSIIELREFFCIEPYKVNDVWDFIVNDNTGIGLSVSFSIADDSLQTSLRIGERLIAVVSHERMTRMWIDGNMLNAEFANAGYNVNLVVEVNPLIVVKWSGLRTM